MLSLTQKAADILARTLRRGEADSTQGFRMVPTGPGELAFTVDERREGDAVIVHEDQTVILIEQWLADMLDGAVLDVHEQAGGTRLQLYGSRTAAGY